MKTISRREEQILIAIWHLKELAYLLAIQRHLSAKMSQTWTIGAIHKPLLKMENSGYLSSSMGGATAKRGGRRKKIYSLTKAGFEALKALKRDHDALWAGFSETEYS
jgi:DNA-binding PadR family transcriptional regulator